MLLVLAIGFGSVLFLMLATGIGAVQILREIRKQSDQLRADAMARDQRLSSMRSNLLLSHTYLRSYLLEQDESRAGEHIKQLRICWAQIQQNLDHYPQTRDPLEQDLMSRLKVRLHQYSELIAPSLVWSTNQRLSSGQAFYTSIVVLGPISVLQLTTDIEQVRSRQLSNHEGLLATSFEGLRSRLTVLLLLALGTATVLAVGSAVYILKLEKETQFRYEEVAAGRAQLERLSRRVVSAQEEERKSISRELHDQVAQTLNALLVDVGNLQKRVTADPVSQEYLSGIQRMANDSVNAIRDIALLLRPSMLDDLGLAAALDWQAREVSRRTGLKVKLSAEEVSDNLPDNIKTCVYRVVQEAQLNAARHAQAKTVEVTVKQQDAFLLVTIKDDGTGFDAKNVRGLGMLGMEERVREAGGALTVDSQTGKGTTISAKIPMTLTST